MGNTKLKRTGHKTKFPVNTKVTFNTNNNELPVHRSHEPVALNFLVQQDVQVRPQYEKSAITRLRNRLGKSLSIITDVEDSDKKKQITFAPKVSNKSIFKILLSRCYTHDTGFVPSNAVIAYLNWTSKAAFLSVFISFLVVFVALVMVFGFFLKLGGQRYPGCIIVADDQFGSVSNSDFADAFSLSWTTFTTVGYGAIYVATGVDYNKQEDCTLIQFLCIVESFFGLIFSGMCTAIMFGKIGRIQSHAQVKFSEAICVVFAKKKNDGHQCNYCDVNRKKVIGNDKDNIPQDSPTSILACPELRIQMVNKLFNDTGGEIFDASLKLLATHDPDGHSTSARIFNVDLRENLHPFLKRVWHARHILDQYSPLLTTAAREKIAFNEGNWPVEWNNEDLVKEQLKFSDLIVTLTGLSGLSSEPVFGAKSYNSDNVVVGYDYASLLYKFSGSNVLRVDMSLINDIVSQDLDSIENLTERTERMDVTSIRKT